MANHPRRPEPPSPTPYDAPHDAPYGGPHELGRNLLVDRRVIAQVVELAAASAAGTGRIVEWAAGTGALTKPLARLGHPLEAVELDPDTCARLRRDVVPIGPHVCVQSGDILRHAPPGRTPYTLVGNVPFHLTTPVLRRLLTLPGWRDAILILQWEVARKRAGVGGTTLLTAQWWPWFEFTLVRRIPAAAFAPRPSVDAGLLHLHRRDQDLLGSSPSSGRHYRRWVRSVFTGRGTTLAQLVRRAGRPGAAEVHRWARGRGLSPNPLPRDLRADDWIDAYRRWGGSA